MGQVSETTDSDCDAIIELVSDCPSAVAFWSQIKADLTDKSNLKVGDIMNIPTDTEQAQACADAFKPLADAANNYMPGVDAKCETCGATQKWIERPFPETSGHAECSMHLAARNLLAACNELLVIVRLQNGNLYHDVNQIQERASAAIKKANGEA